MRFFSMRVQEGGENLDYISYAVNMKPYNKK